MIEREGGWESVGGWGEGGRGQRRRNFVLVSVSPACNPSKQLIRLVTDKQHLNRVTVSH